MAARRASWKETLSDIFKGTPTHDARVDAALELLELDAFAEVLPAELHAGSAQAGRRGRARWPHQPYWSAWTSRPPAWTARESRELGPHLRRSPTPAPAILLIDHDLSLVLSSATTSYGARVRQGSSRAGAPPAQKVRRGDLGVAGLVAGESAAPTEAAPDAATAPA